MAQLKDTTIDGILAVNGVSVNDSLIIESGSNANGKYRKWSDGLLEMWGTINIGTINIATASGGAFYSSVITLPLPVSSSTSVDIVGLVAMTNGSIWCSSTTESFHTDDITVRLFSLVSTTTTSGTKIGYEVKGTWK